MKLIKLPRKEKKMLKKGLWLYPPDEKGGSLMAFPYRYEKDYEAYKNGILRKIGVDYSEEEKIKQKQRRDALDKEIFIEDSELMKMVYDVFALGYKNSSYEILRKAKTHKTAQTAYFNFINAYRMSSEKDSYLNTCCMAVDLAKERMKKPRQKKRKRKNS